MWTTALPSLQPLADEYRLGEQWRQMCIERSVEVALATGVATAGPLAASARAAASAVYLAAHGDVFTVVVSEALKANAIITHTIVGYVASMIDAWEQLDPIGLLERLNNVSP